MATLLPVCKKGLKAIYFGFTPYDDTVFHKEVLSVFSQLCHSATQQVMNREGKDKFWSLCIVQLVYSE